MVSKKEVSAYNLCDLQELHCGTAKFFCNFSGDCILRTAIRFACGNLFAIVFAGFVAAGAT